MGSLGAVLIAILSTGEIFISVVFVNKNMSKILMYILIMKNFSPVDLDLHAQFHAVNMKVLVLAIRFFCQDTRSIDFFTISNMSIRGYAKLNFAAGC